MGQFDTALNITAKLYQRARRVANHRDVAIKVVFERALRAALDAAEATSSRSRPAAIFDPRLLRFIAADPFTLVYYGARMVGIAVEIRQGVVYDTGHFTQGTMLIDWDARFETLCEQAGLSLATSAALRRADTEAAA